MQGCSGFNWPPFSLVMLSSCQWPGRDPVRARKRWNSMANAVHWVNLGMMESGLLLGNTKLPL
jgi:hypothetical protein